MSTFWIIYNTLLIAICILLSFMYSVTTNKDTATVGLDTDTAVNGTFQYKLDDSEQFLQCVLLQFVINSQYVYTQRRL